MKRCALPLCSLLLTSAALLAAVSRVSAITITYDYDERDRPAFDPSGVELRRIVDAAAAIWSNDILDSRSFHFDLSWENLDGTRLGQEEDFLGFATPNIIMDTRDPNGNLRDWFFDPTPFDNSEFSISQTLVRDLDPAMADDAYAGTPPGLLEAGFGGPAISSAAIGRPDLLSAVLHEMGHLLGYNYNFNDGDYDFNSHTIGGLGVGVNEHDGYHGGVEQSLMFGELDNGTRLLPSATDILATFDESVTAVPDGHGGWKTIYFDNYNLPRVDFLGARSNSWDETLNWIGGAVPDVDNQVFIRHGGSVVQSAANSSAKSLLVSENSALFVQGMKLDVIGGTQVGSFSGKRGEIHVGNTAGGFSTLQTDNLQLQDGLVNIVTSTGNVDVDRDFNISFLSTLMGAGVVRVGGTLRNDGQINGGTFLLFGFGGTLTLGTTGTGKFDLDGQGQERGQISAVTGNLAVFGPLADDFNGEAAIGETRTMSFSRPWKMMGHLVMRGAPDDAHLATLAGDEVTIGGNVDIHGQALITAPAKFNSSAVINLPDVADRLTLAGTTTLRGGTFSGNGTLRIAGPMNVSLPNPLFPEDLPTENAPSFFMANGSEFSAPATFDANPVQRALTSSFFGVPTTYSFAVPVTVKTGGVLNASGSSIHLPHLTTLAGGQITGGKVVNQVGDLVVEQNSVVNPTTFLWGVDSPAHTTTIHSGARLDMLPQQIVRSGENAYPGHIKMEVGAALNVDLGAAASWTVLGSLDMALGNTVMGDDIVNRGRFSGNGSVHVNRFENSGNVAPGRMFGGLVMTDANYVQTPAGVLSIALAESLLGNGSAMLRAGTAQLAGTLALSWGASFNPAPGTEFDVLTASSISGVFDNLTITQPFGDNVTGQLLYRSNRVAFRITSSSSPLAGDFNADGAVDGTDLVLWKAAFGAKGDNRTDGAGFLAWQGGFGRTTTTHGLPGLGGITGRTLSLRAVPEPTGLALSASVIATLAVFRRRRLM